MNTRFKLIIAGGKTGGHLFPGIAVAQAVEALNSQSSILFVGTDAPFEKQTLESYGYAHKAITSRPIKGGNLFKKAFSISVIAVSLIQSLIILKDFKPDFVLGVGGFSSFAVVLCARMLNIPTAIQEQNSIPGITNRMLSHFVQTIFTSFEQTTGFDHLSKTRFVGNPVRTCVDTDTNQLVDPALFAQDRFTLLITGGSQGATSINSAVLEAVRLMEKPDRLNIIHQTGADDEVHVQQTYKNMGLNAYARAFFTNMIALENKADLVVARAGAGTLSELCALGKPAILIPFPHAADDHQTFNAQAIVDSGGAEMIADKDLNGPSLLKMIEKLMQDKDKRNQMADAMRQLARPDADHIIATHILQTKRSKR
jgi:UDP-N-acetylglucosamine--N-acetylmuramyl-(pentapeptide) pyrophosphoryl-undecaprenol N-acetylglucosamine transferase